MKAMKADDTLPELIGESPAMLKVKDTIYKLVETDANILITGESGTGKDLVARLLRHYSPRRDDAFVTIDLGSIPEQLFESELFGYEKGAFTDADGLSRDGWRWPPVVRSFWTRSVTCPCRCSLNC